MTTKQVSDVWSFETPSEEIAIEELNMLYDKAKNGKVSARNLLKKVYDDNWQSIKEKVETEGSVWYVYLMDGVRNYIVNYRKV